MAEEETTENRCSVEVEGKGAKVQSKTNTPLLQKRRDKRTSWKPIEYIRHRQVIDRYHLLQLFYRKNETSFVVLQLGIVVVTASCRAAAGIILRRIMSRIHGWKQRQQQKHVAHHRKNKHYGII
jgi:hypothetical protein